MAQFFGKLFNVRTGEWPRLLLLYAMLFIFVLGTSWGTTVVEAAFLEQVGVELLPWVLIAIAVISIPTMALYTAFADRIANDMLLIAILALGILGVITGILLLWISPTLAYPLLYLLMYVPLADIFVVHWFTYVNEFYDTRAAKRLVPLIITSPRIASIIGGLTMPLVNRILPPVGIILLWPSACALMALLAWLMPHMLPEKQTSRVLPPLSLDTTEAQPSYMDNLRQGYQYVIHSPFLRWLAASTLLLTVLTAFLNYQSSQIFYTKLQNVRDISNFVGLVNGLTNLIMLPVLLFGLSRLISAIGLGTANLIYPLGTLANTSLLILRKNRFTAAMAYFNRNAFVAGFRNPIDSLLYNAVPLRVKGRARAFIGGLVVPVGSLIGSAILLLLPPIQQSPILDILMGLTALGFLVSAFFIRKQYTQALVQMLEQEDYSFLLSHEVSDLPLVDPATLGELEKKLEASDSHEMTVFMAELITRIGGNAAVPVLEHVIRKQGDELPTTPSGGKEEDQEKPKKAQGLAFALSKAESEAQETDKQTLAFTPRDNKGEKEGIGEVDLVFIPNIEDEGRTRAALVDILVSAELRGATLRNLYTDLLSDPDERVRQSAITGLDYLNNPTDTHFLNQILPLTHDTSLRVRTTALSVVARSGNFYKYTPAIQALNELLKHPAPEEQAQGIRILGRIGDERAISRLVDHLPHQADSVRLEAALALEAYPLAQLPQSTQAEIVDKMTERLHDPVERIRQAALNVLSRIGTPDSYTALLPALTDTSTEVRSTAVQVLASLGQEIVPHLTALMREAKPQVQKMAVVVLSQINPKEFGNLIYINVTNNLRAIYQNHGLVEALIVCSPNLTDCPSVKVLQSALQEQNQLLIQEIFFLLSASHDHGAVKIISESLQSQDERVQANALEALESLTTPRIASLVAPLFRHTHAKQSDEPGPMQTLSEEIWGLHYPDTHQALQQLATQPNDAWLRAITTFALGEIYLVLKPPAKAEKATQNSSSRSSSRRRRRGRSTALLDALADKLTDETPAGPEPAPTTTPTPDSSPLLKPEEIETWINDALNDPDADVRQAAQAAQQRIEDRGQSSAQSSSKEKEGLSFMPSMGKGQHKSLSFMTQEGILLSTIEKIIFLKEVPFFQSMTIDQLRVLANVCEEIFFKEDTHIFKEGDPGGVLYVVISGSVGIEQESRRKGSFARLATIEAHSYFGEITLFDNSPRTASALALQDTLTLRLRREPLIALARQYPNLSLELINVLSTRLREANDRIAELSRSRPRELQKLYDQFN